MEKAEELSSPQWLARCNAIVGACNIGAFSMFAVLFLAAVVADTFDTSIKSMLGYIVLGASITIGIFFGIKGFKYLRIWFKGKNKTQGYFWLVGLVLFTVLVSPGPFIFVAV